MASRGLFGVRLMMFGVALCGVAADVVAGQMLITVLRSSDPVEVRNLLGSHQTSLVVPADRQRNSYTTGLGWRRQDRWQVVVNEGQAAFVGTTSSVPQPQAFWVEITRHGPVPHVRLQTHQRMHGIHLQARRVKHDVEVQLEYVGDGAGFAGTSGGQGMTLFTTLRGMPGQWLDAGGTLALERTSGTERQYRVTGRDPRRFRLLVRVDELD